MKPLLYGVLGLFFGAAVTMPGCSCFGCNLTEPIPAGTFVGVEDPYFDSTAITEPDFKLVVSSDRRIVTETYTRNGKAYTTIYTVTNPGSGGSGGR